MTMVHVIVLFIISFYFIMMIMKACFNGGKGYCVLVIVFIVFLNLNMISDA